MQPVSLEKVTISILKKSACKNSMKFTEWTNWLKFDEYKSTMPHGVTSNFSWTKKNREIRWNQLLVKNLRCVIFRKVFAKIEWNPSNKSIDQIVMDKFDEVLIVPHRISVWKIYTETWRNQTPEENSQFLFHRNVFTKIDWISLN